MGQSNVIPQDKCVSLEGYYTYLDDTYTVVRTSGEKDAGWRINREEHACIAGVPLWLRSHASNKADKNTGTWRIFMRNSEENPNLHSCGWRRVETIEPTRLSGNEQAIQQWREQLIKVLDTLDQGKE
jgi:hypothetical protein